MKKISIDSISELPSVAKQIIGALDGRSIVVFRGGMGAGKTTLISAICNHLGVEDVVNSPTFAIVNHYLAGDGANVYHFDMYRIEKIEEAYDFGYEEYFFSGDLCLVEWPERIEELLPDNVMTVQITQTGESEREFIID